MKMAESLSMKRFQDSGFNLKMLVVLLFMILLLSACVYNAGRDSINRSTVENFDLKSFMGRWYEIARFDHSFERGMQGVTADYSLQEDGTVLVVNSGKRGDKRVEAIGRAKTTSQVGRLRVSFFWIFYSDYNVLDMGKDGEWVLVGSRSPQYLWVMSRKPHMSDEELKHIINLAEQRGYNTNNLIFVEH